MLVTRSGGRLDFAIVAFATSAPPWPRERRGRWRWAHTAQPGPRPRASESRDGMSHSAGGTALLCRRPPLTPPSGRRRAALCQALDDRHCARTSPIARARWIDAAARYSARLLWESIERSAICW